MQISAAIPLAQTFIDSDIPVFFLGSPGIGKSDLTRELAQGRPLIDFRASLLDPVDLRGIPSIESGLTRWNPPAFFPVASRDGENGILFMDEFTNAGIAVQGALLQLILDRRLGEYELPPSWRIVAAGNKQTDRASAGRLSSAAANRFAHIEIEADFASWQAWAVQNDINPLIVAFLSFRRELLHAMDSNSPAFPTPRAWANVSKTLKACPNLDSAGQIATALCGHGAGVEFGGFVKMWRDLPRVADCLAAPDSAPVPFQPDARFAMAAAIARAATGATMAACIAYAKRLGAEYAALMMQQATGRDSSLNSAPGVVAYRIANQSKDF